MVTLAEVKIPFGRSPNGTPISIDDVERGKDCDCVCWECGGPLVARKGEINQHHFAHYVEMVCAHARETAIHEFAKHTIANALEFRLPDDVDLGPIKGTKVEEWLDGIRPDVLVEFNQELVAVEIRVAHPVPPEKIQKLISRKLATLEIDLSTYKNTDRNEDHWSALILQNAHRFWLFQPAIVRAEIERRAREEAERQTKLQAEREEAERQKQRQREFAEARRRQDEEWKIQFEKETARRIKERENLLQKQQEQEREYEAYQAYLSKLDPLIEGLITCADVLDNPRCAVCGAMGDRKDWQTSNWYCLPHRPWWQGGPQ